MRAQTYPRVRANETLAVAAPSRIVLTADVRSAAREICERFAGGVRRGGGIPAVALRIGTTPGVLYNKLSESEQSKHQLTARDLLLIFLATGEIGHLQALGRAMNCACFPLPDLSSVSDEALLDLLCKTIEEGGRYSALLRDALADGRVDAAERAKLRRQAYEWMGAIAEADARLEGLVDG